MEEMKLVVGDESPIRDVEKLVACMREKVITEQASGLSNVQSKKEVSVV